jgi:hypothetical protein
MTEYKHHNPNLANPLIQDFISLLGGEWQDSSYGNDCCASVSRALPNNGILEVYMPNSTEWNIDKEEFNTYAVKFHHGSDDDKNIECTFETFDEAFKKAEFIEFYTK